MGQSDMNTYIYTSRTKNIEKKAQELKEPQRRRLMHKPTKKVTTI